MRAYLETFVQSKSTEEKEIREVKNASVSSAAANLPSIMWAYSRILLVETARGFLRDSSSVMQLHSNALVKLGVVVSASSIGPRTLTVKATDLTSMTTVDCLRRLVLIYLLITFGLFRSDLETSTGVLNCLFGLLRILIFRTSVVLIASPFIIGFLLNHFIWRMQGIANQTENASCYVLGHLKRLQLTSLGRQMSHPMPPVSKIEESARDYHGDAVLSCPEMRTALHTAFRMFRVDVQAAIFSYSSAIQDESEDESSSINTTQTIGQLQCSSTILFRSLIPSCFQLILQCLESLPNHSEEVSDFQRLRNYLMLPMFIIDITSAIAKLYAKLIVICREANGAETVESNSDLKGVTSSNGNSDCISASYTDARLHLLRLRNSLEDTINRVWLCEQELSELESTRLLYLPASDIDVSRSENGCGNMKGGTSVSTRENNSCDTACNSQESSECCDSPSHEGASKIAEPSGTVSGLCVYKEQGAVKVKAAFNRLVSLIDERSHNEIQELRRFEAVVGKLGSLLALLTDQQSPVSGAQTSLSLADSSVHAAPTPLPHNGQKTDGICALDNQLATFESIDYKPTDHGVGILGVEESERGKRVVDVYSATVTQDPSQSSRRERIDNRCDRNDFNTGKELLAELQMHIQLLELGSSTVERVRIEDVEHAPSPVMVIEPSSIVMEERSLEPLISDTSSIETSSGKYDTNSDLSLSGYTNSYSMGQSLSQSESLGNMSAELSFVLRGVKRLEDSNFSADIDDDMCDEDSYVEVENEDLESR
jgi:hypothetical protein